MEAQVILTRPVQEFMSTNLITVHPDDTLITVDRIFSDHTIHHVPVVDYNNTLLGIISKSDLLLIKDWGTTFNLSCSIRKNNFLLNNNLAADLMSKPIVFLRECDKLEKCLDIFKENYFRAIPIVDDDKYLKGIITPYDLMIAAFRPTFLFT